MPRAPRSVLPDFVRISNTTVAVSMCISVPKHGSCAIGNSAGFHRQVFAHFRFDFLRSKIMFWLFGTRWFGGGCRRRFCRIVYLLIYRLPKRNTLFIQVSDFTWCLFGVSRLGLWQLLFCQLKTLQVVFFKRCFRSAEFSLSCRLFKISFLNCSLRNCNL